MRIAPLPLYVLYFFMPLDMINKRRKVRNLFLLVLLMSGSSLAVSGNSNSHTKEGSSTKNAENSYTGNAGGGKLPKLNKYDRGKGLLCLPFKHHKGKHKSDDTERNRPVSHQGIGNPKNSAIQSDNNEPAEPAEPAEMLVEFNSSQLNVTLDADWNAEAKNIAVNPGFLMPWKEGKLLNSDRSLVDNKTTFYKSVPTGYICTVEDGKDGEDGEYVTVTTVEEGGGVKYECSKTAKLSLLAIKPFEKKDDNSLSDITYRIGIIADCGDDALQVSVTAELKKERVLNLQKDAYGVVRWARLDPGILAFFGDNAQLKLKLTLGSNEPIILRRLIIVKSFDESNESNDNGCQVILVDEEKEAKALEALVTMKNAESFPNKSETIIKDKVYTRTARMDASDRFVRNYTQLTAYQVVDEVMNKVCVKGKSGDSQIAVYCNGQKEMEERYDFLITCPPSS